MLYKALFVFLSFVSVCSAGDKGLRGAIETTFLDEGAEWKQFTNFQEKFIRKYETLHEL